MVTASYINKSQLSKFSNIVLTVLHC